MFSPEDQYVDLCSLGDFPSELHWWYPTQSFGEKSSEKQNCMVMEVKNMRGTCIAF